MGVRWDDEPIKFRVGTRMRKTVTVKIVKYDPQEDSYTVVDEDGDSYCVESIAMHDPDWVVIPDA